MAFKVKCKEIFDALWENKPYFFIFAVELLMLLILLIVFIFFLRDEFCKFVGSAERLGIFNKFILYCINIVVIFSFQIIFYKNRVRKLYQKNTKPTILSDDYDSFFGSKSYIAKCIKNTQGVESIDEEIKQEKEYRKKNIEERIFNNKKKFIDCCFWLSASFMMTYLILMIFSTKKAGFDYDNKENVYRATPINATVIEYSYKSKCLNDTLQLQFHPSIFNYVENGVTYNLADFAIKKGYRKKEGEREIPLIKKNVEFKRSFLKSDTNIFIKELAEEGIKFENIHICRLNGNISQNGTRDKITSFKMVNLYEKNVHHFTKIYNCVETLLFNISSFCIIVLFSLLSYDTHSFKSKFTRQWSMTMVVFLFVLLSVVEICFAALFNNNSYMIGNFIGKSFSALISVIVVAALAGRLNIYYFYTSEVNNTSKNKVFGNRRKFITSIFFLVIYIYAASQIFYPFEEPIIKKFVGSWDFNILLLILSLTGKSILFLVLYLFTKNGSIDKFFVYEINVIKSPSKNTAFEDFYYLMRFDNREDNLI